MRRSGLSMYLEASSIRREEPVMGYGNPLFDGDEPLPADSRRRVLSMRLFFHGLRPRTPDHETGLSDSRHDRAGDRDGSQGRRSEPQEERDQRG
jgi:hypothetical protein